ncbi:hypothetical protein [Sphingobacterium sp. SYP-B4668]|uniref:hypothetical protein n=1 Tax=Sphingobacterium sp. SYP-B4668 TaxID=2996035 RepID=UPI0022DE838E|nr:hypothetical protein [Sphingobacterium sp. SYP-B4668]
MIFKRVNYQILRDLKAKGFTLLVSDHRADDQTPIYIPVKVENAKRYLEVEATPQRTEESTRSKLLLIIDELLVKFDEKQVFGVIRFD